MTLGWALYLVLAALLVLFWRRAKHKSLATLLDENVTRHHAVHRVINAHPRGGTWREHRAWMRADRRHDPGDRFQLSAEG